MFELIALIAAITKFLISRETDPFPIFSSDTKEEEEGEATVFQQWPTDQLSIVYKYSIGFTSAV